MKYKIYQYNQSESLESAEFFTDQLQLIIYINEVLQEDANISLEKLLIASGFRTPEHYQIVNIKEQEIVNNNYRFLENNIKWIWIFGLSPSQLNLPKTVPLNKLFKLLDKQWMLWPAYSILIKNDQYKRLLWQEIKLMLDDKL
jgi:DNA polymerase III psi subunit